MPRSQLTELKSKLIAAGFEIFRVRENRVHLADRVRENLIMDSGVSVLAGRRLAVRIVVKAQANQFPGESEAELFERARSLAAALGARGYADAERNVVPVNDPSGGIHPLDTWYEVALERDVDDDELIDELTFALGVDKTAL